MTTHVIHITCAVWSQICAKKHGTSYTLFFFVPCISFAWSTFLFLLLAIDGSELPGSWPLLKLIYKQRNRLGTSAAIFYRGLVVCLLIVNQVFKHVAQSGRCVLKQYEQKHGSSPFTQVCYYGVMRVKLMAGGCHCGNQWSCMCMLHSKKGFDVKSYGIGAMVRLPGSSSNEPNCYTFQTTYEEIYQDLLRKDPQLYPIYLLPWHMFTLECRLVVNWIFEVPPTHAHTCFGLVQV